MPDQVGYTSGDRSAPSATDAHDSDASKNPCRRELFYTLVLMLLSMSWGMIMGYWSSAGNHKFADDFGVSVNPSLTSAGTIFNLLAPLGGVVGGPVINVLLPRVGRRWSTFVIASVTTCCWFLSASMKWWHHPLHAKGYFILICVFRFLLGASVGGTSTVVPVYITELAPSALKGAFGALHQVGIATGNTLGYVVGVGLDDWSLLGWVAMIPGLLQMFLIWLVPDSPVQMEQGKGGYGDLFQRQYLRPLLLAVGLVFCQQMGGTSAFLGSLSQMFAGGGSLSPQVAAVLVGVAGILAAITASWLVGFFGERVTWILSSICQLVTLLVGAVVKFTKKPSLDRLFIACIFLNNFTFCVGTAGIAWFFVCKLFDDSIRAQATGVGTACAWVFGTLVFYVWAGMDGSTHGDGTGAGWGLILFAAVMLFSAILGVFLKEPEKKQQPDDLERAMVAESATW